MATDLQPVQLSPESAYALLVTYFEDAIRPAAIHHYLRCEAEARLHGQPTTYDRLTLQLRSALVDIPVILETFHQVLKVHNPHHEATHPTPANLRLEPVFTAAAQE